MVGCRICMISFYYVIYKLYLKNIYSGFCKIWTCLDLTNLPTLSGWPYKPKLVSIH